MKNVLVSLTVLAILSGPALATGKTYALRKSDTCIAKFAKWPANTTKRLIMTANGVKCATPLTAFQRMMRAAAEDRGHGGNSHESQSESQE